MVASIPGHSQLRKMAWHCLRMRQLPQDSGDRDILVNNLLVSILYILQ